MASVILGLNEICKRILWDRAQFPASVHFEQKLGKYATFALPSERSYRCG